MIRSLWILASFLFTGLCLAQEHEQQRTVKKTPKIEDSLKDKLTQINKEAVTGKDVKGGMVAGFPMGDRGKPIEHFTQLATAAEVAKLTVFLAKTGDDGAVLRESLQGFPDPSKSVISI